MSTPEETTRSVWRVFPWDPEAPRGTRFSPSYIPRSTGRGRFDLPQDLSPVLYTAETPDHAVGELLQPWRGRPLQPFHLTRAGKTLAVARLTISPGTAQNLANLCDPGLLVQMRMEPDATASRLRDRTQPIAREAWEAGHHGVRWWSSFWGDWHTVVLFVARTREDLAFGTPQALTVHHPAVRQAADLLGMALP